VPPVGSDRALASADCTRNETTNATLTTRREPNMTAIIKRIATRWALPALLLIAGGFVCDGLTEVGHHAFLIAGGIALGIGIGKESR
jgi:hypothetical protein